MRKFHSNPEAQDWALPPDCEVWYENPAPENPSLFGFYWSGPSGDPIGPFPSESEAITDAQGRD